MLPTSWYLPGRDSAQDHLLLRDGSYNKGKHWDDTGLIEVFNAGVSGGPRLGETNGRELTAAVEAAVANRDGPTLIGCVIERGDCSAELISRGLLVAQAKPRQTRRGRTIARLLNAHPNESGERSHVTAPPDEGDRSLALQKLT